MIKEINQKVKNMENEMHYMEKEYNRLERDFLEWKYTSSENEYFLNVEIGNRDRQCEMLSRQLQSERYKSAQDVRILEKLKTKWATEILKSQEKLLQAEKKLKSTVKIECQSQEEETVNEKDSEIKWTSNKTKSLLTKGNDKLMKEIEYIRKVVNKMSPGHDKYTDMVQNLMKKESQYESALIDCKSEDIKRGKNPLYEVFNYETFENGESEYTGDFSSIIFKENSEVNGENGTFYMTKKCNCPI